MGISVVHACEAKGCQRNYFTVELTKKISASDSLFGTYMYDYSPSTAPDITQQCPAAVNPPAASCAIENQYFQSDLVNSSGWATTGIVRMLFRPIKPSIRRQRTLPLRGGRQG